MRTECVEALVTQGVHYFDRPTQARVDLDKLFEEAIHDVLYDPVSQTHMVPKKQPR